MSLYADKRSSGSSYPLYKTAVAILVVVTLAVAGIWFVASRKGEGGAGVGDLHREVRLFMDTGVEIVLPADSLAKARRISNQVFDEMEQLENQFSRNLAQSEISNLNDRAGKGTVTVGADTIDLLEQSMHFSDLSKGAFDPTIAPLLDRWGFQEGNYRLPAESEIKALLPLVDYTLVAIDLLRKQVSFKAEGICLDLGAIAKGYIVDRGMERLRRAGINYGFIDAGGDIGIVGSRPDGEPWRIGIRHPREEEKLLAVIPMFSGAIATSGDYERMFEQQGQRYHHILDPETGYPANRLISATVIAPTATAADALSTAVFVLGSEQGLKLVESLPGVEAVLVTPRQEVIISSGLQGKIEVL